METPAWIKELVKLEVRLSIAQSLLDNLSNLSYDFIMGYDTVLNAYGGKPVYTNLELAVASAREHVNELTSRIKEIKFENNYERG